MDYYKFVSVEVLDPRLSKNVAKNMTRRIAENKCPMLKLVDATTGDDETVFFDRLALHNCWALNPASPIDLFSVRQEAINRASYVVEKYINSAKNLEHKDVVYHAFISIDDNGEKFVRIAEITFYTQVYGSPADDAFRKMLHEIRHASSCMALERIAEYEAHVAKQTTTLARDTTNKTFLKWLGAAYIVIICMDFFMFVLLGQALAGNYNPSGKLSWVLMISNSLFIPWFLHLYKQNRRDIARIEREEAK